MPSGGHLPFVNNQLQLGVCLKSNKLPEIQESGRSPSVGGCKSRHSENALADEVVKNRDLESDPTVREKPR